MRNYRKVVVILGILLLLLSGCLSGDSLNEQTLVNAEPEGYLEFYTYFDELLHNGVIDDFEAMYPGVKVNMTIIPSQDFPYKIKVLFAAQQDIFDLLTLESYYLGEYLEADVLENLGAAPYNALPRAKDELVPYTVEAATDSQGNLRGLSWQCYPGSLIYNREIARRVLGTDDPEEVASWTGSWKRFTLLGEKIKNAYRGDKWLINQSSALARLLFSNKTSPYITDNEFKLSKEMKDFFIWARKIKNEGYESGYGQWGPEWFDTMNGEVFSFVLPNWGLHYVIKPNVPELEGNYGLAPAPQPYYWGGDWLAINKFASEQGKINAWKLIELVVFNTAYMTEYGKEHPEIFSSNLKVISEQKNNSDFNDPYLKGQNYYQFYADQALKVRTKFKAEHDFEIEEIILHSLMIFLDGNASMSEAISEIEASVESMFTEK